MLNKVILMGRLTKDPELKTTTNGVSVCSFTVAVDRKYSKQGEERQADFINIIAWRTTAEFISKYFTKGRMINIVGSIQTRMWDDQGGKKHYATDVVADEVNFCGDKSNKQPQNTSIEQQGFVPFESDDDLPFLS